MSQKAFHMHSHEQLDFKETVFGVCTIISGMLIQALLGIVPTWGNISIYITSYFRSFDQVTNLQSTFIVFPLTLICSSLAMQLGSVLLDILNPKVQVAIGGLLYVSAIYLSSLAQNIYLFLVLYAIMAGFGYGIIYMLSLKMAWTYFPHKKGMVGGIILASHSYGAIGWSFLTVKLVNPHSEAPSMFVNVGNTVEVLYGPTQTPIQNVPYMLQTMSFIFAGMAALAIILINKKKPRTFDEELKAELLYKGIVQDGGVEPPKNGKSGYHLHQQDSFKVNKAESFGGSMSHLSVDTYSNRSDLSSLTLSQSVRHKTFWHIFLMLTLSMSYCYFIKVTFKTYGSLNFNDDQFLTLVAGVSFCCGGTARFLWGTLQDYIGFKRVYATMLLIEIFLSFTITQISSSRPLYLMWIGLSFACEGGHFSIFPPLACTIYGAELGSKIYSLLFVAMALAALTGMFFSSIILPLFGWYVVFLLFACMNLSSLFLLFVFEENRSISDMVIQVDNKKSLFKGLKRQDSFN